MLDFTLCNSEAWQIERGCAYVDVILNLQPDKNKYPPYFYFMDEFDAEYWLKCNADPDIVKEGHYFDAIYWIEAVLKGEDKHLAYMHLSEKAWKKVLREQWDKYGCYFA